MDMVEIVANNRNTTVSQVYGLYGRGEKQRMVIVVSENETR